MGPGPGLIQAQGFGSPWIEVGKVRPGRFYLVNGKENG
jgi:hypothetical protein